MLYGMAFLGGAKYPGRVLSELPQGWALSIFFKVDGFGSAKSVIREAASRGCPRITVQLMWKDNHNFKASDLPEIEKRAQIVDRIAVDFPDTDFRVSGACEHNLKKEMARRFIECVKVAAPHCTPMNTPMSGGAVLPAYLNEFHGYKKAPPPGVPRFDFNFDGTSAVDSDVEAYKEAFANAETFYFWVPQYNGRKNTNDDTPRPERKAWPTPKLCRSVAWLAKNRGGECKLPKNWIWKSHADQHEVPPEPRALKPVVISPLKVARIELKDADGKVVAKSGGAQPFADDRWRYYFAEFGYETSDRTDNVPLRVFAGNKQVGKVNPAYRAGSFR